VSGPAASVTWTVAAPSQDLTPPTISLSAPSAGATLGGVQTISATASDSSGVAKVDFYANGSPLGTATGAPYSYSWNTTAVPNGSYSLTADAYDTAGNLGITATAVNVTVNNGGASTSDPSGQPMPVGDIPGWHQVFADDFTTAVPLGGFSACGLEGPFCSGLSGTPYDNTWFAYPDRMSGTPTSGTYYPSQTLSVQSSMLDYYIHTATINGTTYHMIDAPEPNIPGGVAPGGGLLYGRYIVRARWDALNGYHASFLLWPDSGIWPYDGEIDFPEADFNSTTVAAFMHRQYATCGCQQDSYAASVNAQQWHTYEIDWLPSAVSFYLDGSLIGKSTSNIPNTPMHWVLQTGTSFSAPTPGAATAGHVQIDWASAYVPAA
jgi:hypothetical protein